jgi:putative membrane protein
MQFIITWIVTALSLLITAYLVPGMHIDSGFAAAVGAIVLGLVNAIVKPILLILTFPLTILTLGLFLLVVNAMTLGLVGYFTPGFTIDGFLPALIGSIVLSLISTFLGNVLNKEA